MRILIVDDHPMIVEAVTLAIGALRPDAAVDSTASIEEMVASELEPPDLVLLDLTLPGRSGLDALGAVLQRWPATLVVIFSATDDSASIRRALASGARGFIPKTSPHKVLIDALRLVLDGGTYVPPDILLGDSRRAGQEATPTSRETERRMALGVQAHDHPALSERQRQIVELLAQGLTTKEICRKLGISPNTVKTHIASIFRALGVRNRTQVVAVTQAWLHRQTLQ
jgi:DNA-binding NarL/FixJ family response regulator